MTVSRDLKLIVITVAVTALVTASTSIAAGKYLVSSSEQIKPGVVQKKHLATKARKALRGKAGMRGLTGPAGAPGAQGDRGLQGPQGTARAYAVINMGSSIVEPSFRSGYPHPGVIALNRGGVGVVCAQLAPGIDPATAVALATPDSVSTGYLVGAGPCINGFGHPGVVDSVGVRVQDHAGAAVEAGVVRMLVP